MIRRIISLLIILSFLCEQSGYAQVSGPIDISNRLLQSSAASQAAPFRPQHLRSIGYDAEAGLKMLLDKGSRPELSADSTPLLLNYFLTGVSLPDSTFWVNLRPDAPELMIDPVLAKTDIGRIMLEADLQLKKDTALFTAPSTESGREYWKRLYKKAEELFGSSSSISIPTIARPWIVPGEILLRESRGNVYILKARLKVMLEADHLKDSKAYNFDDHRLNKLNEYACGLIKELVIPKLNKEINNAASYASLRQVYYSLILSQWFKKRFAGKQGKYASMIDSGDLQGLESRAAWQARKYFEAYQKSFKDGEYNVKETVFSGGGQAVRSYFSGGCNFAVRIPAMMPEPGGRVTVDGVTVFAAAGKEFDGGMTAVTADGGKAEADIDWLKAIQLQAEREVRLERAQEVLDGLGLGYMEAEELSEAEVEKYLRVYQETRARAYEAARGAEFLIPTDADFSTLTDIAATFGGNPISAAPEKPGILEGRLGQALRRMVVIASLAGMLGGAAVAQVASAEDTHDVSVLKSDLSDIQMQRSRFDASISTYMTVYHVSDAGVGILPEDASEQQVSDYIKLGGIIADYDAALNRAVIDGSLQGLLESGYSVDSLVPSGNMMYQSYYSKMLSDYDETQFAFMFDVLDKSRIFYPPVMLGERAEPAYPYVVDGMGVLTNHVIVGFGSNVYIGEDETLIRLNNEFPWVFPSWNLQSVALSAASLPRMAGYQVKEFLLPDSRQIARWKVMEIVGAGENLAPEECLTPERYLYNQEKIWNWVQDNIQYDQGYGLQMVYNTPWETLSTGKGICVDFSFLTCALENELLKMTFESRGNDVSGYPDVALYLKENPVPAYVSIAGTAVSVAGIFGEAGGGAYATLLLYRLIAKKVKNRSQRSDWERDGGAALSEEQLAAEYAEAYNLEAPDNEQGAEELRSMAEKAGVKREEALEFLVAAVIELGVADIFFPFENGSGDRAASLRGVLKHYRLQELIVLCEEMGLWRLQNILWEKRHPGETWGEEVRENRLSTAARKTVSVAMAAGMVLTSAAGAGVISQLLKQEPPNLHEIPLVKEPYAQEELAVYYETVLAGLKEQFQQVSGKEFDPINTMYDVEHRRITNQGIRDIAYRIETAQMEYDDYQRVMGGKQGDLASSGQSERVSALTNHSVRMPAVDILEVSGDPAFDAQETVSLNDQGLAAWTQRALVSAGFLSQDRIGALGSWDQPSEQALQEMLDALGIARGNTSSISAEALDGLRYVVFFLGHVKHPREIVIERWKELKTTSSGVLPEQVSLGTDSSYTRLFRHGNCVIDGSIAEGEVWEVRSDNPERGVYETIKIETANPETMLQFEVLTDLTPGSRIHLSGAEYDNPDVTLYGSDNQWKKVQVYHPKDTVYINMLRSYTDDTEEKPNVIYLRSFRTIPVGIEVISEAIGNASGDGQLLSSESVDLVHLVQGKEAQPQTGNQNPLFTLLEVFARAQELVFSLLPDQGALIEEVEIRAIAKLLGMLTPELKESIVSRVSTGAQAGSNQALRSLGRKALGQVDTESVAIQASSIEGMETLQFTRDKIVLNVVSFDSAKLKFNIANALQDPNSTSTALSFEKLSAIAQANEPGSVIVAGINGGFFDVDNFYPAYINGEWLHPQPENSPLPLVCVMKDGSLKVIKGKDFAGHESQLQSALQGVRFLFENGEAVDNGRQEYDDRAERFLLVTQAEGTVSFVYVQNTFDVPALQKFVADTFPGVDDVVDLDTYSGGILRWKNEDGSWAGKEIASQEGLQSNLIYAYQPKGNRDGGGIQKDGGIEEAIRRDAERAVMLDIAQEVSDSLRLNVIAEELSDEELQELYRMSRGIRREAEEAAGPVARYYLPTDATEGMVSFFREEFTMRPFDIGNIGGERENTLSRRFRIMSLFAFLGLAVPGLVLGGFSGLLNDYAEDIGDEPIADKDHPVTTGLIKEYTAAASSGGYVLPSDIHSVGPELVPGALLVQTNSVNTGKDDHPLLIVVDDAFLSVYGDHVSDYRDDAIASGRIVEYVGRGEFSTDAEYNRYLAAKGSRQYQIVFLGDSSLGNPAGLERIIELREKTDIRVEQYDSERGGEGAAIRDYERIGKIAGQLTGIETQLDEKDISQERRDELAMRAAELQEESDQLVEALGPVFAGVSESIRMFGDLEKTGVLDRYVEQGNDVCDLVPGVFSDSYLDGIRGSSVRSILSGLPLHRVQLIQERWDGTTHLEPLDLVKEKAWKGILTDAVTKYESSHGRTFTADLERYKNQTVLRGHELIGYIWENGGDEGEDIARILQIQEHMRSYGYYDYYIADGQLFESKEVYDAHQEYREFAGFAQGTYEPGLADTLIWLYLMDPESVSGLRSGEIRIHIVDTWAHPWAEGVTLPSVDRIGSDIYIKGSFWDSINSYEKVVTVSHELVHAQTQVREVREKGLLGAFEWMVNYTIDPHTDEEAAYPEGDKTGKEYWRVNGRDFFDTRMGELTPEDLNFASKTIREVTEQHPSDVSAEDAYPAESRARYRKSLTGGIGAACVMAFTAGKGVRFGGRAVRRLISEYFSSRREKQNKQDSGTQRDGGDGKPGGIDFRAMLIPNCPVNAEELFAGLPESARQMNADTEWKRIQALVNRGIVPSCQRIREFTGACYLNGSLAERSRSLLKLVADVLRLEEPGDVETEPALKDILSVLEAV